MINRPLCAREIFFRLCRRASSWTEGPKAAAKLKAKINKRENVRGSRDGMDQNWEPFFCCCLGVGQNFGSQQFAGYHDLSKRPLGVKPNVST